MRLQRLAAFLLVCMPALISRTALADAGDAAQVVRFCGTPTSEHQGVSQVTNQMERDLSYGSMILHFEPVEGGWRFLSGWYDHLPLTQAMVERRMPCFQQAIAASAAGQPRDRAGFEDPAVQRQTAAPVGEDSAFGIPYLRLILILSVIVVICFFLPRPKRLAAREVNPGPLPSRRRPILNRFSRREPGTRLDV